MVKTELSFKEALRKLINEAPKMPLVPDYPLEWARIYPEMQAWLAKLATLAGCATRTQEVILLEAK